jgi:hypothetical protein
VGGLKSPSKALKKHLASLEQPESETTYFDVGVFAIPVFEAMFEGRRFSWLPRPDVEFTEEQEQAHRRTMHDMDRIADAPRTARGSLQAEIERKQGRTCEHSNANKRRERHSRN